MKIIDLKISANTEYEVDIRDYGYSCGAKRIMCVADNDTSYIHDKNIHNHFVATTIGIGYKFPIVNGKSPCKFYFSTVEETRLRIYVEELGGVCDEDYFGIYPYIEKVYYVKIGDRNYDLGKATVDETGKFFTIETWGEQLSLGANARYKINDSEQMAIGTIGYDLSASTGTIRYGFSTYENASDYSTWNGGGAFYPSGKAWQTEDEYHSWGYEVYMFVDMSKSKPIYIIMSAPYYSGTRTSVKEKFTIRFENTPDSRLSNIIAPNVILPATQFQGTARQHYRISSKYCKDISDPSVLEKLAPYEK